MSEKRYDRQMRINGWYQERLYSSRASIVGAGAGGSMVAVQLGCLGVGKMDIYDHDIIEETNLNRQFLYFDSVGKEKAIVLAEKIKEFNPDVDAEGHVIKIDDINVSVLGKPDIILDCVDNFKTRSMLNKYAVDEHIPLVSGAASPTSGQVVVYVPKKTRCLDCQISVNDLAKNEKKGKSCFEADPSIITTNWIVAGLMCDEARKILLPLNEKDENLSSILKYDSQELKRFALLNEPKKECKCMGK